MSNLGVKSPNGGCYRDSVRSSVRGGWRTYPLAMRGHSALQGFPHSLPDHQGAHRSQRQLPLYLSPSHPAPSLLAVLPPYLPLCAPSQPIEAIKTPCIGEGAMIIAAQIPTYDTTRMGHMCPIHTYFTPILVHLFMETFGDLSEC